MGVETGSSTGLAERISKATWGSQPQKSRIKKLNTNYSVAFNPHNLKLLFNNLKTLYNRPEVSLEIKWNLDETGANTADIFYVH